MKVRWAAAFATLIMILLAAPGVARAQEQCLEDPPPQWLWALFAITSSMETNDTHGHTAIAGSSDNQGMSVGLLQWNFGQGTLREFIDRVEDGADAVAATTMPRFGAEFLRRARANATSSQRRAGVDYARRMLASPDATAFRQEVRAFLGHAAVRRARTPPLSLAPTMLGISPSNGRVRSASRAVRTSRNSWRSTTTPRRAGSVTSIHCVR
ncbi:hypothetical protein U91I_03092 [alpha proteobacterium U9-1i]|nr:hypothetical protein U91I_03092 [alpha proteobacterium U9-1i]